MITQEGITILCDADKCTISSLLATSRKWATVADLSRSYGMNIWYEDAQRAIVACDDAFKTNLEKMTESFMEMAKAFNQIVIKTIQESPRFKLRNCNNYRKIHHLPLMRRMRCRWRPRESRRVIKGLIPGGVEIDELEEE